MSCGFVFGDRAPERQSSEGQAQPGGTGSQRTGGSAESSEFKTPD